MANWLQKIISPVPPSVNDKNLPVASGTQKPPVAPYVPPAKLPTASVIYAIAASIMLVMALYLLIKGLWFTAILVAFPAAALIGFALHFMRR